VKNLKLLRSGNWVTVDPCPPKVRGVLVPRLTFVEREFKQGGEKAVARKKGAPLVEEHHVECFADDHRGRVSFPFGFVGEMTRALEKKGYAVELVNLTPHPNPKVFEPHWDKVFDGDELRYKQDEFLIKVACYENGRFDCPTGYGKSFMCGKIAQMLPFARIAIVSDSVTVVRDRIYPELAQMVPNVGIVGGGLKRRGRRVMCYTADSMHWMLKDCDDFGNYDVVIFDECHLAAADKISYMLAQIPGQPRMYGLSASQDMRADGKDYRVRGLFGPLRMKMDYKEAQREGIVVPMEVRVRKVVMNVNPAAGLVDEDKMRAGVWRNDYRNDMIVKDAVGHAGRGEQTMISCQVLEHVLAIKQRFDRMKKKGQVPEDLEMVCIYRQHESQSDWYAVQADMGRKGLGKVFEGLPYMSNDRRQRITKKIEQGKIVLFVGTTILNVGFDPKDLMVVSRADCTSNKIADTQVPGRNARHGKRTKGGEKIKKKGVVRDYWDKFDDGLSQRYKNRERSYKRHGWPVKILARKSALRSKLKTE
jgi:superfamily II DNA or RNA helicase